MSDSTTTSGVAVKLGDSPLTNFILMFSDKMHILDDICTEMSGIVSEIEQKEQELDAMMEDVYKRTQQYPRCPSLRCSCWTLAPITKRFLDKFSNMRAQKERFKALKDHASSYIDELKDKEPENTNESLDLTAKK